MKNKDCDIPAPIKVLGWCLIGFVVLYFCKELLGYSSYKDFLEAQGSLIAGMIAFVAAVIALYSQKSSVNRQLDYQRKMEEDKVFREKLEEMYHLVQEFKVNVTLTRTNLITDIASDIDIYNKDIAGIIMLQRLYKIADEDIFNRYVYKSVDFLQEWGGIAEDYVINHDGMIHNDSEEISSRYSAY